MLRQFFFFYIEFFKNFAFLVKINKGNRNGRWKIYIIVNEEKPTKLRFSIFFCSNVQK